MASTLDPIPQPIPLMYTCSTANYVKPIVTSVSVLVLPANPLRRGIVFYNNGANSAYICFSSAATSTDCAFIIPTFSTISYCNNFIVYTGPISAIRNAATGGALNCYELLAAN